MFINILLSLSGLWYRQRWVGRQWWWVAQWQCGSELVAGWHVGRGWWGGHSREQGSGSLPQQSIFSCGLLAECHPCLRQSVLLFLPSSLPYILPLWKLMCLSASAHINIQPQSTKIVGFCGQLDLRLSLQEGRCITSSFKPLLHMYQHRTHLQKEQSFNCDAVLIIFQIVTPTPRCLNLDCLYLERHAAKQNIGLQPLIILFLFVFLRMDRKGCHSFITLSILFI